MPGRSLRSAFQALRVDLGAALANRPVMNGLDVPQTQRDRATDAYVRAVDRIVDTLEELRDGEAFPAFDAALYDREDRA